MTSSAKAIWIVGGQFERLALLAWVPLHARLLLRGGSARTARGTTMAPAIQKPAEHHCQRNDHDTEQLLPNTRHSRPLLFHMRPTLHERKKIGHDSFPRVRYTDRAEPQRRTKTRRAPRRRRDAHPRFEAACPPTPYDKTRAYQNRATNRARSGEAAPRCTS